ncbi:hypothetical protein ABIE41_003763 [Bosea sp. OAE506]
MRRSACLGCPKGTRRVPIPARPTHRRLRAKRSKPVQLGGNEPAAVSKRGAARPNLDEYLGRCRRHRQGQRHRKVAHREGRALDQRLHHRPCPLGAGPKVSRSTSSPTPAATSRTRRMSTPSPVGRSWCSKRWASAHEFFAANALIRSEGATLLITVFDDRRWRQPRLRPASARILASARWRFAASSSSLTNVRTELIVMLPSPIPFPIVATVETVVASHPPAWQVKIRT